MLCQTKPSRLCRPVTAPFTGHFVSFLSVMLVDRKKSVVTLFIKENIHFPILVLLVPLFSEQKMTTITELF